MKTPITLWFILQFFANAQALARRLVGVKGCDLDLDTVQTNIVIMRMAPGAPDALCMTPGPHPVLFVGDLYPSRIYKVSLEGKLLGWFGTTGKRVGQFFWVHEMHCSSDTELYVGEAQNWRVQKITLKK